MTATPVSKPDRPRASFGKTSSATREHHDRIPVLRDERVRPAREVLRVVNDLHQAVRDHEDVQRQVDGDDHDGEVDRLSESLQEDRAERAVSSTIVTRTG